MAFVLAGKTEGGDGPRANRCRGCSAAWLRLFGMLYALEAIQAFGVGCSDRSQGFDGAYQSVEMIGQIVDGVTGEFDGLGQIVDGVVR